MKISTVCNLILEMTDLTESINVPGSCGNKSSWFSIEKDSKLKISLVNLNMSYCTATRKDIIFLFFYFFNIVCTSSVQIYKRNCPAGFRYVLIEAMIRIILQLSGLRRLYDTKLWFRC